MPFIGIISIEITENCIRRCILEKLKLPESSVLFIKEKSIENIKNIKFETILVARSFENTEILKKMLESSTYVVINSDIENNFELIEDLNATVVTYGFNSKATITASSVGDEEMMICLQRTIRNKNNENIEPQEIKVPIYEDASCTMAVTAILTLYSSMK